MEGERIVYALSIFNVARRARVDLEDKDNC